MKQRCRNKKHDSYHRYGGRDIRMCDDWYDSFITFYRDMGATPFNKATIDRIDNNGDYCENKNNIYPEKMLDQMY